LQARLAENIWIVLYPGLVTRLDSIVGVVDLGESLVAVDAGTGLPGSISVIARSIAGLGWPRKPLRYTINTHGHAPNAGGDWWFHDALRAIIVLRDPDAGWVEQGDDEKTGARELGVPFRPTIVGLRPTVEEYELYDNGRTRITLLHTPGHTPGSQSIIVESSVRVVFVGDALGRLSRKWESSEPDWWESLRKVRGRDPDILCTSVTCMDKEAAKRFLEEVESVGPEWVDG